MRFLPVDISIHRICSTIVGLLLTAGVQATAIQEVNVAEMLEGCDLVFEGRVIEIETRKEQNTRMIHTNVKFEVLDVIKGKYSSGIIELSFLGGTAGGRTLKVDDMHVPELHEKGIYFVESLSDRQVHPFYGWSQGHFVIIPDDRGIERVMTRTKKPVVEIEPAVRGQTGRLSSGTARGLQLSDSPDPGVALTVKKFKERLSAM